MQPRVLDDLAVRPAFFFDVTEYYRWKHDWLRRLDHVAYGGKGIVLVAAQLLQTPIDSLVASAVLLRDAIERSHPSEIVYVGPPPTSTESIWRPGGIFPVDETR